ncbi:MAG: cell division protein FtsL [Chloroflexota bacterium]
MAVARVPSSGFRVASSPTWGPVALPRALPQPETKNSEPGTRAVRPRELRNTVSLLVAILLISVVGLLYMNEVGRLATSGYQTSSLQQERDRLQRENQGLEVQLSQLRALPRVEQVATQKLHMTKGDLARVQYVQLDPKQLQLAATPDGIQRHG